VPKTSHPDVDRPFVSHPDRSNHNSNQARSQGRPGSRGDDRGSARVQPNSDNGRRGSDSGRNEQERGRHPENNRGRGNDSSAPQDARVQPYTDNGRRGNDSRRTDMVTFPRNGQERGRQPENNRGWADASEPRAQSNPLPSSSRRTDETQRESQSGSPKRTPTAAGSGPRTK